MRKLQLPLDITGARKRAKCSDTGMPKSRQSATPVPIEPVTWPLTEGYGQKELLKAARPKRKPRASASGYANRFHTFSSASSSSCAAPPPLAQAIDMPFPSATTSLVHVKSEIVAVSSSRQNRAAEQVDLDADDLNF